jgi:hypothetical protein
MSTSTATQTASVLVIAPGRAAEEREVAVGTTVAELAEKVGLPADAGMQAFGSMNERLGAEDAITAETEVVNFVVRLAGAAA